MLAAAEKGDEAFISAAYEHASEDTKDSYTDDSYTLRTGVHHSESELSDWLFDTSRKTGDATCIESDGTYYIAIFESRDTHDYAAAECPPHPDLRYRYDGRGSYGRGQDQSGRAACPV